MDFIDLKTQYLKFKPAIHEAIDRVLEHGRFIMGPEVEALENALADYVGCRHAITVASGTDSLEIALRALEIGPGDEVITVPFTPAEHPLDRKDELQALGPGSLIAP